MPDSDKCGQGTREIFQDGVPTCVVDDRVESTPTPDPTPTVEPTIELGKFTTLDWSSPDAIQESIFKSLLPNLVDNVAEIAPMLYDPLVIVTSLAGIIPISAGVIVGMALLFKKMRYKKKENDQKIFQQDKKKRFSFPKINFKKKKEEEKTNSLGLTETQTKKVAEVFDDNDYDNYLKQMEAEQTANDFHDSLAEEGITPQEIQDEIDSKERDLDVITDPKEATEVMQEIEEMVDDKKSVEESLEATGGFVLPESLDPVRDPDKMSLEELEKQIKESGHNVDVKPDEIEITENPELTVIEKPSEAQIVKSAVEESSEIMEDELDSILPEDFNPTPETIQQAQDHFDQPDPTEDEIAEVQKLVKEGMSQDDAINEVVKKAKNRTTLIVEEELTAEESVIKDMKNEQDIFKLDIPAKKKSKLSKSFEKSKLGQKIFAKKKAKEKELDIKTVKQSVLTDLGHKRMVEYAGKIEEKMLKWSEEQNLNEKARQDLKNFSLFASMCEMMVDQKSTKKRYWDKIIRYDIS